MWYQEHEKYLNQEGQNNSHVNMKMSLGYCAVARKLSGRVLARQARNPGFEHRLGHILFSAPVKLVACLSCGVEC